MASSFESAPTARARDFEPLYLYMRIPRIAAGIQQRRRQPEFQSLIEWHLYCRLRSARHGTEFADVELAIWQPAQDRYTALSRLVTHPFEFSAPREVVRNTLEEAANSIRPQPHAARLSKLFLKNVNIRKTAYELVAMSVAISLMEMLGAAVAGSSVYHKQAEAQSRTGHRIGSAIRVGEPVCPPADLPRTSASQQ